MKVYLVEIMLVSQLETIAIKTMWKDAYDLLNGKEGIITEIELDEEYPEGIGVCQHWHYE